MKSAISMLLLASLWCSCASSETDPAPEGPILGVWTPLFNGENLDGWRVKFKGFELDDNHQDTFCVRDGLLCVDYSKYESFEGQFGHLFYEGEFSHYRIRVEYRFVGEQVPGGPGWAFRNNGIMVHGQSAQSMKLEQEFPVSIEVQLLGGDGTNARSTGNLCTPGTNVVMNDELLLRHCLDSQSETFHGDHWVTAEVEVRGSESIRHFINGQLVMSYTQPQLDERDPEAQEFILDGEKLLSRGTISLQAESHPCEFRKIELMLLEE
ncbi:MAG: hypothetical protein ACI9F9_001898 [Candidatus Paceibacteria bacterium]|jgi:hypothetical protein